jgi:hypothetical protein
MEFYTSHELEYLVVRRESQERRQKTRVKLSPALTRRFHIDNSGTKALILIKGGRWLLTASDLGSVSYYDLETREPMERPLIPGKRERDSDGSFHVVKMDVDIDDESAVLSFNLALYLGDGGFLFILQNFNLNMTCITRVLPVNSSPNRSSMVCNSPTRWPKPWNESLSDASVLFSS